MTESEIPLDLGDALPRPRYIYSPISASSEIRLVQYAANAFKPDGAIDLSMITVQVSDLSSTQYFPLSYVWGPREFNLEITIDGCGLPVTDNLYSCLVNLHEFNFGKDENIIGEPYFWIDALCIDQSNLEERGKQVSLMAQIYQNAGCTLAWLGSSYHNSDLAIDMIELIWHGHEEIGGHEFVNTELLQHPGLRDGWLALHRLFQRQWWVRVWIQQEYTLSKRILMFCGTRWCSSDVLFEAINTLDKALDPSLGPPGLQVVLGDLENSNLAPISEGGPCLIIGNSGLWQASNMRNTKIHRLHHDFSLPLLYLLNRTTATECTDPRDAIYAMLGLARGSQALVPRPDYASSVQEVFTNLVVAHIDYYKDLDIICYGRNNQTRGSLPSWVPDWALENEDRWYLVSIWGNHELHLEHVKSGTRNEQDGPVLYAASRGANLSSTVSSDRTRIVSTALWLGTINGLGWSEAPPMSPVLREVQPFQSCTLAE
ncbi:HET-domain-containing protein [Microthyrium microscopicum]|uniref:HET-domain-containing protein n=1 Tax=Microthyrium microscopicum TaxID=703497 RepID=A0A6A6UHG8_9PEZI|nr:HET-domain-containing protein [Microthyrium microscopicum]